MNKVVVIGSLNYDIFLSLNAVPKTGETARASASSSAAGGKGANQAVQMSKLGMDVSMIGRIGSDQMGMVLLNSLESAGVNCEQVIALDGSGTGMGIVDVFPDGSVMAVISGGANERVTKADVQRAEGLIQEADMLVLQLEIPLDTVEYAIELATKYGKKILLNAAPAAALPDDCIRKCTYFVVNEVEASFYAGVIIDSLKTAEQYLPDLASRYDNCWICTLGKQGAVILQNGMLSHISAVRTDVIETTGAGDSFVGGFAYGIINGMNEEEAGHFAAWCSAVTIRGVGAQNAMPTLEQINMLKKEFGVL